MGSYSPAASSSHVASGVFATIGNTTGEGCQGLKVYFHFLTNEILRTELKFEQVQSDLLSQNATRLE